ncbi:MAG: SusC/RagA family TonB-linked outer membrane protein [Chitinophagaceae bacterium]|nr:SusC/RagA family TonB-linked outer membrane protein [Chitinophagaceae bacterium]
MKLTTILLTVAILQASATGIAQEITLSGKDLPLQKAFAVIKKQTGYVVFYNKELLTNTRPVSLHVQKMPLEKFLDIIFQEQPLGFIIRNKTIVLAPKKKTEQQLIFSVSATMPVTGILMDEKEQPVPGASIVVKGSKRGATSGYDGKFRIDANPGDRLIISSIGFIDEEIIVNKEGALGTIVLKLSASKLDEVQFIAYGTTTKRLSTGNISTIKGDDIAKQPVTNPLLAMQGRVPGLHIVQRSGIKGASVDVQVQGRNSIGNGSQPLYIIDGVPYNNDLTIMGSSAIGAGNPFSYINPNDIESVDILKDADATSIYGSRAASGAIIITTKKGKAGKNNINIVFQQGVSQLTRKYKLLNTEQYLVMREEAKANDHDPVGPSDYDLNGTWDRNRYTDWQKALLNGKAKYTDANLSFSGGSANTQYLISGTYHRETSIFPDYFAGQTGATHFNISSVSSNNKFKIQLTGSYLVDESKNMSADLTSIAISLAPNAPALYNEDGTLNWQLDENGKSTFYNPLAYRELKYNNKTSNLVSNLTLSYLLTKNIELKNSFGFNKINVSEVDKQPASSNSPDLRPYIPRISSFGNTRNSSWIIEPQINYYGKFRAGTLQATVGGTIDQRSKEMQGLMAMGYTSDILMDDPTAAPNSFATGFNYNQYKYAGAFARLNANWDNRYIISLNGRRDGSSRFGHENQFHNFASASAVWIFSNEDIVKDKIPFLSFGKLKIGYGSTGTDQINDYEYMTLYSTQYTILGYQGVKGLEPTRLSNPYLQWEQTNKFDLGMDFGFFNDRILIQSRFYVNRSNNQLLNFPLSNVTGFPGIRSNSPATLQNKGIEITLNTANIRKKYFTWKTDLNFTLNKNKLVKFPGLESSGYANDYVIGLPVNIKRVFDFAGVDPQNGLYVFRDRNGKLTSTPDQLSDRVVNIAMDPTFYGGLGNSFRYKGLQLDILLQFVKQKGEGYYQYGDLPGFFYSRAGNQPVTVLDRWRKPGDISPVQYFSSTQSNALQFLSMRGSVYENASFIRVKNVSISWSLPAPWLKKCNLANAQLFVNAQNLATISDYSGLDPETRSSKSLPPLRTITGGFKLTL